MPLKRYKVNLEFTFDMNELTDEVAETSVFASNKDEVLASEWFWRDVGFQRQLVEAVLAKPEILQRLVQHEVRDILEADVDDMIEDWLGSEDYDDILTPVIEEMTGEAAEYFNYNLQNDTIIEATEQFLETFSIELTKAELTEVNPSE